jgi:hypothetical protein
MDFRVAMSLLKETIVLGTCEVENDETNTMTNQKLKIRMKMLSKCSTQTWPIDGMF